MQELVYKNFFSMGTRFDIVLPGIDEESADSVCHAVRSALALIEEKISIYKEDSVFSRLNREAFSVAARMDHEIFSMLSRLAYLSEKTCGYFDYSMGSAKMATNHDKDNRPESDCLAKKQEGLPRLVLDREQSSIHFTSEDVALDSGGFGKGYGLEKVEAILQSHKVASAFVSFGESSLLAFGHHPYGSCWKTGIQNIFDESECIFTFDLLDEFLSVSGNTPKNIDKYKGGHIVNPHTGIAVEGFIQVAVAGKTGMATEVLSTALCCAPEDVRSIIAAAFPEYRGVIIEYNRQNRPEITFSFNL